MANLNDLRSILENMNPKKDFDFSGYDTLRKEIVNFLKNNNYKCPVTWDRIAELIVRGTFDGTISGKKLSIDLGRDYISTRGWYSGIGKNPKNGSTITDLFKDEIEKILFNLNKSKHIYTLNDLITGLENAKYGYNQGTLEIGNNQNNDIKDLQIFIRFRSFIQPDKYPAIAKDDEVEKILELLENNFPATAPNYSSCHDVYQKLVLWIGKIFPAYTSTSSISASSYYYATYGWTLRELWKKINNIKNKPNILYHGAPGTGKTYDAKLIADFYKMLNTGSTSRFVQFHPNYDYEDFIEGIRPVIISSSMDYRCVEGEFKAFCRQAGKFERNVYTTVTPTNPWPTAVKKISGSYKGIDLQSIKADISGQDNGDKQPNSNTENNTWDVFREKMGEWVEKGYIPAHVFIVDEINRADLSRVLGESFNLLDGTKRGPGGRMQLKYSAMPKFDAAGRELKLFAADSITAYDKNEYNDKDSQSKSSSDSQEVFWIPCNVIFVGTMNDIDRNVEGFDLALRRRFDITHYGVQKDQRQLETFLKNKFSSILSSDKRDEIVKFIQGWSEKLNFDGLSEAMPGYWWLKQEIEELNITKNSTTKSICTALYNKFESYFIELYRGIKGQKEVKNQFGLTKENV